MIKDSNIIYIKKRANISPFLKSNLRIQQEDRSVVALDETFRNIGSSVKAVNEMIKNGDELKALMPSILGLSPNSTSSNWDSVVKNYWDSLFVQIDDLGKALEVGFIYDFNDREKRVEIERLTTEFKEIKDDASLMKVLKSVDKNGNLVIAENKKYLYATAIEPSDYLLWRYCTVYSRVANKLEDVDKSPNIAFYLYSKGEIENARKKQSQLEDIATKKYMDLIAEETKVDEVLLVLNLDIQGLDKDEKHILLKGVLKDTPEKFIKVADDKHLSIKAEIEKLINAGIFNRLDNSQVIVDTENPELVIGINMTEAITFFNLDTKKAKVSEYRLKYKSLK